MHHEFVKALSGATWMVDATYFRTMLARAEQASMADIQAAMAMGERNTPTMVGDIAVIQCAGPITYKSSWFSRYFGGLSIEEMQAQLRAALAEPMVRTIIFRWDSPGGSVEMCPEFADEIYQARGQKALISVADTLMCSAASWLGSQADTVYVSGSSRVGSIGVYAEHCDISEMLAKAGIKITLIAHGANKTLGNQYEPLSDEARAEIQQSVDEIGNEFDGQMGRARGISKAQVLKQFGQGKVFRGKAAIDAGLADKMGTFGQVIARMTKGKGTAGVRADATTTATSTAVADAVAPLKAAESVCETCGKSSCACTASECPPDCPTCSPECPCLRVETEEAKAPAAIAPSDEAAILAVLV